MMDPLMALVNRVNAPTTDRHTAAPKRRFPASPARNQRRKPPTPASPRTSTLDHLAGLVGNDGAARLVAPAATLCRLATTTRIRPATAAGPQEAA